LQKLLADIYDSANQPAYLDWDDAVGFRRLLGRLRLDAVLYDRVVFNDQGILDGVLILDAAKRNLLDELPWSHMEIRSRAGTLEESFVRSLVRPEQDNLVPVFFASIPDAAEAYTLSEALGQTRADKVRTTSDFAALVRALGLQRSGGAEQMLAALRQVASYFASRSIPLVPWRPVFDFDRFIGAEVPKITTALQTSRGRTAFEAVWNTRNSRNRVAARLIELGDRLTWEEERDFATIRTWYNFAYQKTLGHQHECSAVEVQVSSKCWPALNPRLAEAEDEEGTASNEPFVVPDDFLLRLGRMPASAFSAYFDQPNEIGDYARRWRQAGSQDFGAARSDFKRALEGLVKWAHADPFAPPDSFAQKALPVGIGVAAGFTAGHLLEKHAHKLTKRSFLSTGLIAVGAMVTDAAFHLGTEGVLDRNRDVAESIVQMEMARTHTAT
jgi:hypothetical protein